jgi:protein-L-isoaspartate(D-aspartate) O-methyltransferase
MVSKQIRARGIADASVLRAMERVRRDAFVPAELAPLAYADRPLLIGEGQTISQPYVVAWMTEALAPKPGDRVLEVGTGSGYQAAVLAEIVGRVFTVEIVESLARRATERLAALGYGNVTVRAGDGYRGWPEEAPFDGVLVTAATPRVPPALLEQLREGGRLVLPLGDDPSELVVLTRTREGTERRSLGAVRFVPMTGEVRSAPR